MAKPHTYNNVTVRGRAELSKAFLGAREKESSRAQRVERIERARETLADSEQADLSVDPCSRARGESSGTARGNRCARVYNTVYCCAARPPSSLLLLYSAFSRPVSRRVSPLVPACSVLYYNRRVSVQHIRCASIGA